MLSAAAFVDKKAPVKNKKDLPATGSGFAVLELFTSEGCSSCPPADEVLARVQKEAGDKPVYVLAYHVDYWNRLGWKDVFSKPEYSKRQYQYSRQFAGQVYTPQVIFNGRAEFVGSDEPAINAAIKEALNTPAPASLNLQGKQSSAKLDLDYQVTGDAANSQLMIAVVQKHALSVVKKGENAGRTLSHAQIVHELYAIDLPAGKKGTKQIDLPVGFNSKDWEIIGLIQNSETGLITAAGRASLSAAAPTL
ncbi:DUF1223 domain-containing protein [Mucilaginibacter sp. ZT4R22]|uniref:DUF1223 domain-containing protein n=2 Tax=Mucilaginibacter pankratovii TaxID=2772110 RepID=A0ABR7WLN2_9SPHI|nr:DUF1223 domain-containing protein [Mucilaginibacter pankratovii]